MRILFVLLIGALGCLPKPPSITEPESDSVPLVFGERAAPVAEVVVERFDPITPGECPGVVGDVPVVFFGERVLLRLAIGFEDDNLVEVGPTLARSWAPVESIDCRPQATGGATILSAAVTLQTDQPALSLEAVRELAMAEFGHSNDYAILEGVTDPDQRRGMWVVELTASDRSTTRALVALKGSSGFVVALIYEARLDAWPALVDSFVESGKRMVVIPG